MQRPPNRCGSHAIPGLRSRASIRSPISTKESRWLASKSIEFRHDGATWRFHSEANRAAFAKDPDLYMPRYGGHDPVAVGQGTARPGDPDFWAVRDKKLFLFQSEETKRDFELDPGTMTMMAETTWPYVRDTIAP